MNAQLSFIGDITTPYQALEDCPPNIQFEGPLCQLNISADYQHELSGLAIGQCILVMYWLGNDDKRYRISKLSHQHHQQKQASNGTFALRTPIRPNPIGVAVLPIENISDKDIQVRGLDCINNTPLIDIKPAIYLETLNANIAQNGVTK